MSGTYCQAPHIETLDLVSELRAILAKPNSGIEAALRIEQHIHEVLISHTEGPNPTLAFVSNEVNQTHENHPTHRTL